MGWVSVGTRGAGLQDPENVRVACMIQNFPHGRQGKSYGSEKTGESREVERLYFFE